MANKETLLTRQGFERFQAEYDHYWKVVRPETVARVAAAAAEGDRSENAEYIYGRKKMREIDRRLAYLGKQLKNAKIVDPSELRGDTVAFASTVVVETDAGERRTYTLVGEGEADSREGTVNYKSPIGRALMGKRVGDEVPVDLPNGDELDLTIVDLFFGDRHYTDVP